ncbi:MAG: Crp/Fnr family transcriptional regulator [Spirochaetota bacterium]|nr:Crp/Fnr family transcriptional regulator [Spirochaetota bacterium]
MSNSNVFTRKHEKNYKENEIIFNEGDKSKEMYFVLEGEIRVIKTVYNEIQTLGILKKGDFFGEMSTFTDQPRIATAIAVRDSRLLVINPNTFQTMIENHSDFGLKVVKTLCFRLESADQQIEDLMFQNQTDKIISILYNEATEGGKKQIDKTNLNFTNTVKKIESMSKFTKEIIIKLLDHLSKNKIISLVKINDELTIEVTKDINRRR